MRLLLDTQVVLWQLSGESTLSRSALSAIDAADDLLFSAVSFAEVGIKSAIGKLKVPPTLRQNVSEAGLRTLNLTAKHGLAVADLPLHHRDPFDRLLIAQTVVEHLTIVTSDRMFLRYGIPVIDAAS